MSVAQFPSLAPNWIATNSRVLRDAAVVRIAEQGDDAADAEEDQRLRLA
jgi:hypothetical protein